jgi:hypothetical protein
MATGATEWVWENSRASNGSLIVLLAIADECGEGEFTEMKIADLASKCRLSDRAVRMAVKDLEGLGELAVETARGTVSRYAPRQNLPDPPAKSAGPAKSAPRQNLPDPLKEPQVNGTPAKSAGHQISDALNGSVVSGKRSKPRRSSDAPRPDVDRLCEHLANQIEANGSRRPVVNDRWRNAARLMIDVDGRTEEQIRGCIDWSQKHHFWHRNILSMEKLRTQYDRLFLEAKAEREKQARPRQSRQQETDEQYANALKRIAAREAAANDPLRNGGPRPLHQISLPRAAD